MMMLASAWQLTFAPPMHSMSKSTYVWSSIGSSKCTELSVLLLNSDHKILENWDLVHSSRMELYKILKMHEENEIFILKDRRTALIYEGKLFHRLNVGQNKGSVGHGTICLKEGLSHSKWDGWTVCRQSHGCQISLVDIRDVMTTPPNTPIPRLYCTYYD